MSAIKALETSDYVILCVLVTVAIFFAWVDRP